MTVIPLRKAVIPLDAAAARTLMAAETHGSAAGAVGEDPDLQTVVEEARAAGLSEILMVTEEGTTVVDDRHAGRKVYVAGRFSVSDRKDVGRALSHRQGRAMRQRGPQGLGAALCAARDVIGSEPVAVLVPGRPQARGAMAMLRLLARYRQTGGNVVAVLDDGLREREGSFAAVSAASLGRYILQPDVFKALERQPAADLHAAILSTAEAWPLSAVRLRVEPETGQRRVGRLRRPAGLQVADRLSEAGD